MSIEYTYEIISVDPVAKAMEIVYTSPGRQTMHIGARMPFADESIEAVVRMYSPVAYWLEQEREIKNVVVGESGAVSTAGSVTPINSVSEVVTLESAKLKKLAEIADWRYSREVSGLLFSGSKIRTDRESQATISGAYSSLKDGLITSVDWKDADGNFVVLGLAEMTAIAQAVAAHVQQSFTIEKAYVSLVNAAASVTPEEDAISAVMAIVPGVTPV